jgi:hypothetical protein
VALAEVLLETIDLDHLGSSSDENVGGRLLVAR